MANDNYISKLDRLLFGAVTTIGSATEQARWIESAGSTDTAANPSAPNAKAIREIEARMHGLGIFVERIDYARNTPPTVEGDCLSVRIAGLDTSYVYSRRRVQRDDESGRYDWQTDILRPGNWVLDVQQIASELKTIILGMEIRDALEGHLGKAGAFAPI